MPFNSSRVAVVDSTNVMLYSPTISNNSASVAVVQEQAFDCESTEADENLGLQVERSDDNSEALGEEILEASTPRNNKKLIRFAAHTGNCILGLITGVIESAISAISFLPLALYEYSKAVGGSAADFNKATDRIDNSLDKITRIYPMAKLAQMIDDRACDL